MLEKELNKKNRIHIFYSRKIKSTALYQEKEL